MGLADGSLWACGLQVHQGLRELDAHGQQVARNTAAGAWGSSNSRPPAVPREELAWLHDSLRSTEQMHKQQLQALLKGLPGAANEVSRGVSGARTQRAQSGSHQTMHQVPVWLGAGNPPPHSPEP
jgi:hypothetical protein